MKCKKCGEFIGYLEFTNELCIDCFADEWGDIRERYPKLNLITRFK